MRAVCLLPVGRVLGVHGLHRRDIFQLDWCDIRWTVLGRCSLWRVVLDLIDWLVGRRGREGGRGGGREGGIKERENMHLTQFLFSQYELLLRVCWGFVLVCEREWYQAALY